MLFLKGGHMAWEETVRRMEIFIGLKMKMTKEGVLYDVGDDESCLSGKMEKISGGKLLGK